MQKLVSLGAVRKSNILNRIFVSVFCVQNKKAGL